MSVVSIRPRFTFTAPSAPDEMIERLRAGLELAEHRCVCRVVGSHVDITVIRDDRHRWSPCLSLEFEACELGSSVRGLVGPHPSVWTFYALAGISLVFLLVTLLIVAFAQQAIGSAPTALWWAGACAGLLVGLYAVSQVGRRLAAPQTRHLVGVLEKTLGVTIDS